jgi:hypothetical protein
MSEKKTFTMMLMDDETGQGRSFALTTSTDDVAEMKKELLRAFRFSAGELLYQLFEKREKP